MPRLTYNGVVVEVSDETAALLPSDYKPAEEKKTTTKATSKRASSSKSTK
jgi:hypothetical protein